MSKGIVTAMRAATISLALLLAGCGWFRGDDAPRDPAPSTSGAPASSAPASSAAPAIARAGIIYDIYSVVPNQGFLPGGESIRLSGIFPPMQTIVGAYNSYNYRVFFGNNIAAYDNSFAQPITVNDIYVLAPAAAAPGFVDIILRDTISQLDAAAMYYSYEYLGGTPGFSITAVNPDRGPLSGGQQATISGTFPIAAPITNLAVAQAAYGVYFGTNTAAFDTSMSPLITSTSMNVIVPTGDAIGFVDVGVEDLPNGTVRSLASAYEYYDDFAIFAVDPDAGPLAGGQQVTVIGRFPISAPITSLAEAEAAYGVYFGLSRAAFDTSMTPLITSNLMYVITPPGPAVGSVDVAVRDLGDLTNIRTLVLGYEYLGLNLASIDPGRGYFFGDEPIELRGSFAANGPIADVATAAAIYTVYFGYNVAPFDSAFSPVVTADRMYVLSPATGDIDIVDVRVEENSVAGVFSQLDRAFRYYSIYIDTLIPNFGPQNGGNFVRIPGLFLTSTITNVYTAQSLYSVFFGDNQAEFADLFPPDPVITAHNVNLAAKTYTSNRIYVIAPAGDAPGLVDIQIISNLGREPRAVRSLWYLYEESVGIGQWLNTEVAPNPVGRMPAGDLLVTIEVSGAFTTDTQVFIVPQGGDPDDPNHRIDIIQEGTPQDTADDTQIWTGTNAEPIRTVIFSGATDADDVYADGHAALYILDEGEIIGDDFSGDLSDGDRISPLAQEGRHFIIDTIPPRMVVDLGSGPGLSGNDFINQNVFATTMSDTYRAADTNVSTTHPHGPPLTGLVATIPVPYDDSLIIRPDFINDDRGHANLFFNVASLTNNLQQNENLRFNITVRFVDDDLYTALDFLPDTIGDRDRDPFTGSNNRPVAGFELDGNDYLPIPAGDAPSNQETVLQTGEKVVVQWDFLSESTATPEILDIETIYAVAFPETFAFGGITVDEHTTELETTWNIGTTLGGGIIPNDDQANMMMSIIFRAVDRAGDYFPLGNPANSKRKNFTFDTLSISGNDPVNQIAGPLKLWWLRDTGTQFTQTNIPSNEDTRTAFFEWRNSSLPDPKTVDDPLREFNYRVWWVDPNLGLSREDGRDGPYTPLMGWDGWSENTSFNPSTIQEDGAWHLIVVEALDEAGNVERWPTELGPDDETTFIDDSGNDSQRNWRRWYVPPPQETIDTEVTPNFWHDRTTANGRIDSGERVLGNIDVVPLAPRPTEVVSVRFRVEVLPDASTTTNDLDIEWVLLREGQPEFNGTAVGPINTVVFTDLGDPINRTPVHYTFRATGFVDLDGGHNVSSGDILDSTPVNFSFVVVDNVAEFIENRRTSDQQPIKEIDRP